MHVFPQENRHRKHRHLKITRFSTTHAFALLGIATLLALPQAARADVVFSTFGPADSFSGSAYILAGVGSGIGYRAFAMPFTPSSSFTLNSVEVAGRHDVNTNNYSFQIVNDAAGSPGATIIASGTITSFTAGASIQSFAASGAVSASTNYWLTMSPGANDTWGGWYLSSPNVSGTIGQRAAPGGAWSTTGGTQAAFRINGTLLGGSAPEPGTLALLALGMVGGAVVVRRRK